MEWSVLHMKSWLIFMLNISYLYFMHENMGPGFPLEFTMQLTLLHISILHTKISPWVMWSSLFYIGLSDGRFFYMKYGILNMI